MPSSDGASRRISVNLPLAGGLCVLALAVALGYLVTYGGGFYFDDVNLIVLNPYIRDFSHWPTILSAGRPMRTFTFMLDYHIAGLHPKQYHVTNILLHYTAAVLVFVLAKKLIAETGPAVIAAFLFAVHPVHVEAVAAISHRKESLATVFILLALLCALNAYGHARRRWAWWTAAGVACGVGFLSKQTAIVTPLLFWLCAWLGHHAGTAARPPPRRVIFFPLAIGAPVAALAALAVLARYGDFSPFAYFPVTELLSPAHRELLLTSVRAATAYLGLLLWPMHLTIDHFFPRSTTLLDANVLLAAGVLITLTVVGWRVRTSRPLAAFGLGWIAVTLTPMLNIIPTNFVLAERYLYLPAVGWACVCIDIVRWANRSGARNARYVFLGSCGLLWALVFWGPLPGLVREQGVDHEAARLPLLLIGGGVWILLGAAGAWVARTIFSATESRHIPSPWVFIPTGALLLFAGYGVVLTGVAGLTPESAGGGWRAPFFIDPSNAGQFEAIVRFYDTQPWTSGMPPGASLTTALQKAWSRFLFFGLAPAVGLWVTLRYIARVRDAGRAWPLGTILAAVWVMCLLSLTVRQSIEWVTPYQLWRNTLHKNPYSYRAHNNLAVHFDKRGRPHAAIRHYHAAARLQPGNPEPWFNLGLAFLRERQIDMASASFENAVAASPAHPAALVNLGNIARMKGDAATARGYYRQAIARYEGDTPHLQAWLNLTSLALETGDSATHAEGCAVLMRHRPDWDKARRVCEQARAPSAPQDADAEAAP